MERRLAATKRGRFFEKSKQTNVKAQQAETRKNLAHHQILDVSGAKSAYQTARLRRIRSPDVQARSSLATHLRIFIRNAVPRALWRLKIGHCRAG
jgi:hypothetical protein